MASDSVSMEVAMNFYEHKDVERFLAEAAEKGVSVQVAEDKPNEYIDYIIGGIVHIVRFAKPGKPVAMTLRPA